MLTYEDFAPLVGTTFALADAPGELVLIEAEALPATSGAPRAPFSLLFEGPSQPILEQQIHTIRHATLGALELFLVPLSRGGDAVRYQAIFA